MSKSLKNNSDLQPIFLSKEQYQELLRLVALYGLVKQASPTPTLIAGQFGDYILKQGEKFGIEQSKMDEMEWFQKITEDVFDSLFHYSQHQAWEHLANRMAHRDARQATDGTEKTLDEQMQSDLFLDIMGKQLEVYLDEFSKNGIKNLKLIK